MWILIISDYQVRKVEVFHSEMGAQVKGALEITGGYVDESAWQPCQDYPSGGKCLQNSDLTAIVVQRGLQD